MRDYVIYLNDRCNNNCLFCFQSSNFGNIPKITKKEAISKLYIAKSGGYGGVNIFGGEPTIYPFLTTLIKTAEKLKLSVTLSTNARMFCINTYAELFKNLQFSVFTTLYSHEQKIHDKITQSPGSFNETVKGIKNILKIKKSLVVNLVITKLNLPNLSNTTLFLKCLGIKKIFYSGLCFTKDYLSYAKIIPQLSEIVPNLRKAIKTCVKNRVDFRVTRLPVCIEPMLNKKFILDPKTSFINPKECAGCIHKECCMGIEKHYLPLSVDERKKLIKHKIFKPVFK